LLVLFAGLLLSTHAAAALAQGAHGSDVKRVTLYGPIARNHDSSRALYSFKTGAYERHKWDLNYGSLYAGEEHDWFQVSAAKGVRSAVRDLGAHEWADSFGVPVVEPFPVLKEGEERVIKVDTSGADGEDGAPGAPGADADGVVRPRPPSATSQPAAPRRKKNDGVPKIDPVFVKAVVGHVYVLRVVDGGDDFYVLFRVESLARGDNCTITWKRVPPPSAEAAGGK
jgi:hypothetical protein